MIKALLIKIIVTLLTVATVTTATVVTVIKVKEAIEEAKAAQQQQQETVVSNETINVGSPTVIEDPEHVHSTLIITPGVEASCTENGLSEGKKCADCGLYVVSPHVIPAVGHIYKDGICVNCGEKEPECEHKNIETLIGYASTCITPGLTEGSKCKDCGQILVAQDVIPALGHTYKDGICETCGHHRHDDCDSTNVEITPGYEASCLHAGLTDGIVCLECGEIIATQDIIERLDHDYLFGICTMCGEKQNSNCKHTETVILKGYSSTCTQSGLSDGFRCADCGKIVKKQATISSLGHKYVNGVCIRCGANDPNISGENETEKIELD